MPKLPAIVAMIMQLVKVRRDLSSAFVNLASVGMDKIAQVTELLRTTIYFSPSQKQFKQRPGVLVLVVKKPAQLISQFLIKFKLPFNIQIIHLLSLNKSIYIYILFCFCFVFCPQNCSIRSKFYIQQHPGDSCCFPDIFMLDSNPKSFFSRNTVRDNHGFEMTDTFHMYFLFDLLTS